MLEAFQSLRDELTTKKQAEVDQTSVSASKPGTSTSVVNLDPPPPRPRTTCHAEEMEVEYGPALPPRLASDRQNASDQSSNASEEPSKKVSDRPKKLSHSHKRNEVDPRSASDQYYEESDEPTFHLLNPKNMLTRVDIRSGPGMCHLPQRRISPL